MSGTKDRKLKGLAYFGGEPEVKCMGMGAGRLNHSSSGSEFEKTTCGTKRQ